MDRVFDLPSYEEAREMDPWPFIIPHMPKNDLLSLACVNSKLRNRVAGYLWAEPRKFWPRDAADAFVTFAAFIEAVRSVKSGQVPGIYNHALDLSLLSDQTFYVNIPKDWLAIVLLKFPYMRALQVTGAPFFDVSSIKGIQKHSWLRLLDASHCSNLNPSAIHSIIAHFPNLFYLDLSGVKGLHKSSALGQIGSLQSLQILRLRQCNLIDHDLCQILGAFCAIESPLRSLDIRNNYVTDDGAIKLTNLASRMDSEPGEEPPPYYSFKRPTVDSSLIEKPHDWMKFFGTKMSQLPANSSSSQRFDFTDDPLQIIARLKDPGFLETLDRSPTSGQNLTHLYISGNRLTARGVIILLSNLKLQAFDCGSIGQYESHTSEISIIEDCNQAVAVAAAVIPILEDCPKLNWLRTSHHIVTGFLGSGVNRAESKKLRQTEKDNISASQSQSNMNRGESERITILMRGISYLEETEGSQWTLSDSSSPNCSRLKFSAALMGIKTLVLSSVPNGSGVGKISTCLRSFLHACGQMENIQAEYEWRRDHEEAEVPVALSKPKTTVVIQNLVLEMAPEMRKESADLDAEALLEEASKHDFSFFPQGSNSPKEAPKTPQRPTVSQSTDENSNDMDVIQSLKEFRRLQREACNGQEQGNTPWTGKLQVIR